MLMGVARQQGESMAMLQALAGRMERLEALLETPEASDRGTILSFTGPLNQPRLRIAPQP